jgi:prepilin-type processing-associated H-X9-DG protein
MQCSNNMKQWGLAAHNHHDAQQCLPSQFNYGTGVVHNRFGVNFQLLPFMEQTAIQDGIKSCLAITNPWTPSVPTADDAKIRIAPVSTLLCPSDATSRQITYMGGAKNHQCAKTNIVFSLADIAAHMEAVNGTSYEAVQSGRDWTLKNRAADTGDISHRSLFIWYKRSVFGEVTDGLSNTILISEAVTGHWGSGDTVGPDSIKGTIAVNIDIDDGTFTKTMPSVCMGLKKGNTYDWGAATTKLTHPRGGNYLDAYTIYVAFHTIMPPNAPSCTKYQNEAARVGMFTATSHHSGGVNCGLLDGSVRFITDSVDTNGLSDTPNGIKLRGQSLLGVWGALGSIAGGESKAL